MGVVFRVCCGKQVHLLCTGAMHEQPVVGREGSRNGGVLELLLLREIVECYLRHDQLAHRNCFFLLQAKALPSTDHRQ